MRRHIAAFAALLALTFSFSHPIYAHHSDAGIDESRIIVLEGEVTAFRWRQPHVYLEIETTESGGPEIWDIQLVAINVLSRRGWSRDSLKEGDAVVVHAHPAVDGRTHGKLETIQFADGTPVAINPEATEIARVPAESMHGQWSGQNPGAALTNNNNSVSPRPALDMTDPSKDRSCSGGFDCAFIQNLMLTDAGWAARRAYDPLSSENPETTCVGRPTPAAMASARGYMQQWDLSQQEEKILIRSEWFNELRTIWMDGRGHPDPSETYSTGHSIGYWAGDTLIVDTRNFDNHRSPYQIGVPSGSQKHVVERYTLSEDRTYMNTEFLLEDPEYIARPLVRTGTLFHSPHETLYASDCDPDNTSRFAPLD
jgi:hypothetical protein